MCLSKNNELNSDTKVLLIACPFDSVMFNYLYYFRCRLGNYLVLLFLFSKLLYIANVITQFFMLNKLLNFRFNLYGWAFLTGDWKVENHDWTESSYVAFPRVTMCDLEVRRLGNTHPYAVQCTLPINLFNEKIYLFLWFWFFLVACVSVGSFLIWLTRTLLATDRVHFIKNHLKSGGVLQTPEDRDLVKPFVRDFLRQDGVFIMRLVAQNVDGITATEFCSSLFEAWKPKRENGTPFLFEPVAGASSETGSYPQISYKDELPGKKAD